MVRSFIAVVFILVGSALALIDFNGLNWQVGPDRDMSWNEAKEWVDGLGGNWRMPTRVELRGLWDAGISSDNWGLFENSGSWVWSGEREFPGSSSAWDFNFNWGHSNCPPTSYSTLGRAFAVRSTQTKRSHEDEPSDDMMGDPYGWSHRF